MRFSTFIATTFALLATPVLSAPLTSLVKIEKFDGEVKRGSYIVKLKNSVSKADYLNWLTPHLGSDSLTHTDWQQGVLNGFAGTFSDATLRLLRSNPDVEGVAEDGIVSINSVVTQTDAPWGLSRISQDANLTNQDPGALNFTYKYDDSAGAGVDVYIVDTGIFTDHEQFEGRARWGKTFGGYPDADGNGHGTHVAGTVGSRQFGVAKKVNLIAVKVLSDSGSGSISDIVSGLNFVMNSTRTSGRPSIASMSLGGSASTPLDNAVASLTTAGIHVTVAAGNDGDDAKSTSPARAPSANTIGASTIADASAFFSNFGAAVDLYAPGQDVISTWIGSANATNTLSGTSMATPHVAGLIATLISQSGNTSPDAMSSTLKSLALKGVLTGIPSGTLNDLARNDI